MGLFLILGIAVAAAAASPLNSPQTVRLGSIGIVIADIKGNLVPKSDSSAAVPVFEFQSLEHADSAADSEHYTYRCSVVTEYINPQSAQPFLACRNSNFKKGTLGKQTFLVTHRGFHLAPGVREVEILVGKSIVDKFLASNSVVPGTRRKPIMEGIYDGFHLLEGKTSTYDSLLDYTH